MRSLLHTFKLTYDSLYLGPKIVESQMIRSKLRSPKHDGSISMYSPTFRDGQSQYSSSAGPTDPVETFPNCEFALEFISQNSFDFQQNLGEDETTNPSAIQTQHL